MTLCNNENDNTCTDNGRELYEFTEFNDIKDLDIETSNGKIFDYPRLTKLYGDYAIGVNFKCQEPWSSCKSNEYGIKLSGKFEEQEFNSDKDIYFSSIDFARGLLKRHTVYNSLGIINETVNEYQIKNSSKVYGLNGLKHAYAIETHLDRNWTLGIFWKYYYKDPSEYDKWIGYLKTYSSSEVFLTSTTEKKYDQKDSKSFSEIRNDFFPTTLNQIKKASIDQSDGIDLITEYTYPSEISFSDHPSSCYDYANTAEQEYNDRRSYCYSNYSTENDRLSCMNRVLASKYTTACYDPATGTFLKQSCIDNCTIAPLDPEAKAIQTMMDIPVILTPHSGHIDPPGGFDLKNVND